MKRKCKFLIDSNDGKKTIYIDDENFNKIISYTNKMIVIKKNSSLLLT